MSAGANESAGRRLAETATRLNRSPQMVALRSRAPGFLGELGLTALQAWQRLAEAATAGRSRPMPVATPT